MAREEIPADALRVAVSYHAYCTHDYHDGEQYGEWSRSYDFSVTSARAVSENYQEAYSEDVFRVPAGSEKVYVLYMIYSWGDSFGHSDGEGIVLGCFANREIAMAAQEAAECQKDDFTITVKDDFGRDIKISNPGAGYFERVSYIGLQEFGI